MRKYTYLALGDSYTIGEQLPVSQNFPNQTVDILAQHYQIFFQEPTIIAVTGWTTDELISGIANTDNLEENYDWVSLLIGVNNQYRGQSIEEYKHQFAKLLDTAVQFANNRTNRTLVLSIPDYSTTPFSAEKDIKKIANEIERYNQINAEVSADRNVHYLDITPSTIAHGSQKAYLTEDLLHYSQLEYKIWAKKQAEIMANQFQKN